LPNGKIFAAKLSLDLATRVAQSAHNIATNIQKNKQALNKNQGLFVLYI